MAREYRKLKSQAENRGRWSCEAIQINQFT